MTGVDVDSDWFVSPYVGAPWDHDCGGLQSERLSVSVLVPVWNSQVSVAHCLSALSRSSFGRLAPSRLEVIVCDDGSTDDSWNRISSCDGLELTALRLDHRNQSAALNAGLARAGGDIVVFCDSDIVIGCGALDELVARHERWSNAVCFGFRSDIPADHVDMASLWDLMHEEAFSRDNRVAFELPTLVPNMLDATNWLSLLSDGRFLLDSQGHQWRRHRFVYGCLFSARRDQVLECDGFPDVLDGWGFGDTLMAARLEANGGFLMPVASAWGHHVEHEIRHPDQWFQMGRNDMAYQYLLAQPQPNGVFWRTAAGSPVDTLVKRGGQPAPLGTAPVRYVPTMLRQLGRWSECLPIAEISGDDELVTECLFRLGRPDDATQSAAGDRTLWGALSHHRLGDLDRAYKALEIAAQSDASSAYAYAASVPELSYLARHYSAQGLPDVAGLYVAVAEVRASREGAHRGYRWA
jgi:hypothetical protein